MPIIDALIFATGLLLLYYYNTRSNNRLISSYGQISYPISTFSLYVLIFAMRFGAAGLFNTVGYVYKYGPGYFLITFGDVAGVLLYYWLIRKIYLYKRFASVGEIMGHFYNSQIRFITGICSIVLSISVIAIQFQGIYRTIKHLFNINFDSIYLFYLFAACWLIANARGVFEKNFKQLLLSSLILIIMYFLISYDQVLALFFIIVALVIQSSFGGISATVFKSMVYFSLLILILPIVFNEIAILNLPVQDILTRDAINISLDHLVNKGYIMMIFHRLLPLLPPPLLQRISMASSSRQAMRAFLFASLTLFVFYHLISVASLTAAEMHANIHPQDCFLCLVQYVLKSPGLLGLVLCCILSIMFASIDAFVNTAATSLVGDVFNKKIESKVFKISATVVILAGLLLACLVQDMFTLFLFGFGVWGTIITIPLFAAIYGFKVSPAAFYASCISGILINILYYSGKIKFLQITGSLPAAFVINIVVFAIVNFLYYRNVQESVKLK